MAERPSGAEPLLAQLLLILIARVPGEEEDRGRYEMRRGQRLGNVEGISIAAESARREEAQALSPRKDFLQVARRCRTPTTRQVLASPTAIVRLAEVRSAGLVPSWVMWREPSWAICSRF